MRRVLIDLFCKAGGATKGYQRAGFYVIGVDLEPQPRYCGDDFIQMDAEAFMRDHVALSGAGRTYRGRWIDAFHASPPCQGDLKGLAAVNRKLGRTYAHRSMLASIRGLLTAQRALGHEPTPYVIEQPQMGAQLINPVRLCGSSFALPIRRHRQFESNVRLAVPPCDHSWQTEKKYWTGWRPKGEHRLATVVQVYGNGANRHEWPAALGIDWMNADELTQAIPPAFTECIGRQIMAAITQAVAA